MPEEVSTPPAQISGIEEEELPHFERESSPRRAMAGDS
jgi:hypothetical protein